MILKYLLSPIILALTVSSLFDESDICLTCSLQCGTQYSVQCPTGDSELENTVARNQGAMQKLQSQVNAMMFASQAQDQSMRQTIKALTTRNQLLEQKLGKLEARVKAAEANAKKIDTSFRNNLRKSSDNLSKEMRIQTFRHLRRHELANKSISELETKIKSAEVNGKKRAMVSTKEINDQRVRVDSIAGDVRSLFWSSTLDFMNGMVVYINSRTHTNHLLDIPGGKVSDIFTGNIMQWYPSNRNWNQQFKVYRHSDGTISIRTIRGSGLAIQVGKATRRSAGGYRVTSKGKDVMLGPYNGKPHQKLQVVEVYGKYVRLQFKTPEKHELGWVFLEPVMPIQHQ